MNASDKRLLKLVNDRQRLIKRIEKKEREHGTTSELRGRLVRITAEELKVINKLQKRKVA